SSSAATRCRRASRASGANQFGSPSVGLVRARSRVLVERRGVTPASSSDPRAEHRRQDTAHVTEHHGCFLSLQLAPSRGHSTYFSFLSHLPEQTILLRKSWIVRIFESV